MNIFWLLLPTISDNKKLQSLDRPEPGGGEWSVESLTPGNTRHCVMLSRDIPKIPDTDPTQFLTVPAPLSPHFSLYTSKLSTRASGSRRPGEPVIGSSRGQAGTVQPYWASVHSHDVNHNSVWFESSWGQELAQVKYNFVKMYQKF